MIRFLEQQRLRHQLHERASTSRAAARCCSTTSSSSPAGTTSTGRPSQRTSMENARDAGVNLAFFSGNDRLLEDALGAERRRRRHQDRTLVSYKDTHFDTRQDPVEWTGTWRDPRFTHRRRERHARERADGPVVPRQLRHVADHGARTTYGQLRMWRNTAAATLAAGAQPHARARRRSATSGTSTPTTASARRATSGSRRRRSSDLEVFTDYGSTTKLDGDGDAQPDDVQGPERRARVRRRHRAVGVGPRRPEPGTATPPDHNMQQATVNLFADMGAQPRDAAARARGRHDVDGHDRADVDDHVAPGDGAADGHAGHDQRHRVRRRRRQRRRRRDLHRRRRHLASRDQRHDDSWTYTLDRARQPDERRSGRAPPTTAATSRRPARARRSPSPARARSGARTSRPRHAGLRRPTRRSRSASSSRPTRSARSPASASTRRPPTPARTSAASGPPAGSAWRRRRSPARRRRAGRP